MDPQSPILALVFLLDRRQFAIGASAVSQVIRAVAITPAADATGFLLGAVNVRGRDVTALSLRAYLGLPDRPLDPSQHFILVHFDHHEAALLVDEVESVVSLSPEQLTSAERLVPGFSHVEGVARLDTGVILIEDLASVLAAAEVHAKSPSTPV
jgi:purine-binding chemotaxis protein CheW